MRSLSAALRRVVLVFPFLGALADPALAAKPEAVRPHPAMFKIEHAGSTVYLLGSIHIIKASLVWRTPEIDAAIAKADAFAFETPMTPGALRDLQAFVDVHGILPRGEFLHQKLSPKGLADYKALLEEEPDAVQQIDHFRPWYASLVLGGQPTEEDMSGVDIQMIHYSLQHQKKLRYMETLEQQMKALTGDPKTEVAVFESEMHESRQTSAALDALTELWITGNTDKMAAMADKEYAQYPGAEAALLDTRNAAWVPEVEAMLNEKKTIFITVGAMHLSGPKSVVARLCARGWNVQRVATGGIPVPPACTLTLPQLRQANLR